MDDLEAKIQSMLEASSVPGAAVVVVENGEAVLARGFGLADVASGRVMTADTRLRAGSLSKNLTTLAAIKLAAEGRLNLDAPISRLAPDVVLENPWEEQHPLTLRHLLGHTGGLEGSTYYEYATSEPDYPINRYVREMRGKVAIRWPPGFFFSYANPGHTLAAAAIEQACACAFDTWVEENLFAALGMEQTTFRNAPDDGPPLASSYHPDGVTESESWLMPIRPSGSLVTTINDLGKLVAWYAEPEPSRSGLQLADAWLEQMRAPQQSAAGRQGVASTGYALGTFKFSAANGHLLWGHTGSTEGFQTWLGYEPGGRRGFALIINGDDGGLRWRLRGLLGAYLYRNEPPATPVPAIPAKDLGLGTYEGWYAPFSHDMPLRAWLWHVFGAVRLEATDEGLRLQPLAPGEPTADLIPTTPTTFRVGDYPEPVYALVQDPDGRTVLVGNESYEPISGLRAFGRFGLLVGSLLIAVGATLAWLLRWAGHWARGWQRPGTASFGLMVSGLSMAMLLWLFVRFGLTAPMDALVAIGRPSSISIGLLMLSLLGPLAAVFALWRAALSTQPLSARPLAFASALILVSGWTLFAVNGWVPLMTFQA
ncbi:MAG: serine hydrolase domain-containing protein [Pseudomonadota bacterium]